MKALVFLFLITFAAHGITPVPLHKPVLKRVKKKENLLSFVQRTKGSLDQVKKMNGLTQPYKIYIGQPLWVKAATKTYSGFVPAKKPWRLKNRLTLKLANPQKRSGRFSWPVRGKVISKFGQKNDGILIQAATKSPVKASEHGVVAFAGEHIKGLGGLVLVKHAEGWITAYGRLSKILVKRGDAVQKGEKIALAELDPKAKVHFELRHKTNPKNPQKYLR